MAAAILGVVFVACGGTYATLRGGEREPTPARSPIPVPMPVARLVDRRAAEATDYSIVSVFDGLAFLATSDNLVRTKVGLVVPGLGTITKVEAASDGRATVAGTRASLRAR